MNEVRPLMNNVPPTQPRQARVLIVEDQEDSRNMLKVLLGLKGYEVIEAGDGERAFRLAEELQPDLILMDINLPVQDGLATFRQMRKCLALRDVPIILTSGYSTSVFLNEVRAAGCEEFLVKPLDFDKLDSLLERHLAH